MRANTPWLSALLITLLVGSIAAGVALAASSATLLDYQVDFVDVTGAGQSRVWTYAVTASGNEQADLSSWALTVDSSCNYKFKIFAVPFPTYTTPESHVLENGTDICSGTYACMAATYDVTQTIDNSLHMRTIHFTNQDPGQALSSTNPGTHLFQIEIVLPTDTHRIGDTGVMVDTGTGGSENGQVTGAVCPPTAIQLVNLSASTRPAAPALFISLLVAGVVILSGWVIYRRAKVT